MSKVILVTGSNAGIGLELVRLLAKENVVYMTSRNEVSGKESQCVCLHRLGLVPTARVTGRS
jgi:NAD(P)-dependent dehydrogenase (short-subunit alcohol dehydrogenase family)